MAIHNLYNKEILFYGRDILVVAEHFTDEKCVVTFTSKMENKLDIPPEPFAADMLSKESCSHICFVAMSNHWWQTSEFDSSVRRVVEYIKLKRYRKTISYGGSMGGVGVIHSSAVIQPDVAIVFGAQYDISPNTVPWDGRWHADAANLPWPLKARSDTASTSTKYLYIYDPNTLDARHFDCFRQFIPMMGLALECSGHETFTTLRQIGLAGFAARHLLLSNSSLADRSREVKRHYREKRKGSIIYWRNLAQKLVKHKRHQTAERALQEALKLAPDNYSNLLAMGWHCLTHTQKPSQAEAYFNECVSQKPEHPAAWRGKSKCRTVQGDHLSGLEFAIAALARKPDNHDLSRVFLEAANKAKHSYFCEISAKRYLKINKNAGEEDFFKRFVKPEFLIVNADDETKLATFETILRMIGGRNPQRYTQLLQFLVVNRPRTILEVGVFNGDNALQMIVSAGGGGAETRNIKYFGFDLFEQMTEEKFKSEFSKMPLAKSIINDKISQLTDHCRLIMGDTLLSLPGFTDEAKKNNLSMDFVFIDGGHSESTIESDWKNIRSIISNGGVIFFDDYYVDKAPALDGLGCNRLIEQLKTDPAYRVELLPITDAFEKDFGILKVGMVKVMGNQAVRHIGKSA